MADRYINPTPEMAERNKARDVRDSFGWTNEWCNGPTYLVDWIGIHPSRDYDLMFFSKDTKGPLAFVYCKQHMCAHGTGWCTVNPGQKIPLNSTTIDGAREEVRIAGLARLWRNAQHQGHPVTDVEREFRLLVAEVIGFEWNHEADPLVVDADIFDAGFVDSIDVVEIIIKPRNGLTSKYRMSASSMRAPTRTSWARWKKRSKTVADPAV
jgi:hypothetical protein